MGTEINRFRPVTLGAVDQFTHWVDVGTAKAGIVVFALQFSGTWNATVTFQGAVKQAAVGTDTVTYISDPIAATNLVNGTTVASTTTGTASETELWRVDAAGLDGVRCYITVYVAGSVTVIPSWVQG